MAKEAITECEQCGVGVLNPGVHDQWHRGEAEPTAPACGPAASSSPPTWWDQMVAAHDLRLAQKQSPHHLH